MNRNHNTVPATDGVISAQLVNDQQKTIIKILNEIRSASEQKDAALAQYQAEPMNVLRAEDIDKAVTIMLEEPEGYLSAVAEIRGEISAIKEYASKLDFALLGSDGNVSKMSNHLLNMGELLHRYLLALENKQQKPNGFRKKFMTWWTSWKVFLWRVGLFLATLAFNILLGLYCYRWSDDAWARRAYDAAVKVGVESPENLYRQAREHIDRRGLVATKKTIVEYEESVKQLAAEEEQK